jgi:hypothetical protein
MLLIWVKHQIYETAIDVIFSHVKLSFLAYTPIQLTDGYYRKIQLGNALTLHNCYVTPIPFLMGGPITYRIDHTLGVCHTHQDAIEYVIR